MKRASGNAWKRRTAGPLPASSYSISTPSIGVFIREPPAWPCARRPGLLAPSTRRRSRRPSSRAEESRSPGPRSSGRRGRPAGGAVVAERRGPDLRAAGRGGQPAHEGPARGQDDVHPAEGLRVVERHRSRPAPSRVARERRPDRRFLSGQGVPREGHALALRGEGGAVHRTPGDRPTLGPRVDRLRPRAPLEPADRHVAHLRLRAVAVGDDEAPCRARRRRLAAVAYPRVDERIGRRVPLPRPRGEAQRHRPPLAHGLPSVEKEDAHAARQRGERDEAVLGRGRLPVRASGAAPRRSAVRRPDHPHVVLVGASPRVLLEPVGEEGPVVRGGDAREVGPVHEPGGAVRDGARGRPALTGESGREAQGVPAAFARLDPAQEKAAVGRHGEARLAAPRRGRARHRADHEAGSFAAGWRRADRPWRVPAGGEQGEHARCHRSQEPAHPGAPESSPPLTSTHLTRGRVRRRGAS